MSHPLYPEADPALAKRRRSLAPNIEQAFVDFGREVFDEGALPAKTKHLIAVAVAHATQCPWCIRGHSRAASRYGASAEEIMESIWVAAEMRAGAAYAHAAIALDEIDRQPVEPGR
jgi:AhpD family alkylhydroperoxidase